MRAKLKATVFTLVYLAALSAALFVSAGTAAWFFGWACIVVLLLVSLVVVLGVSAELIEERSSLREGIDVRDAVLAMVSYVFLCPVALVVAGLDAKRFGWSPGMPFGVQLAALAVIAAGYAFACWAMLVNRFFSTFVRIQEERGHAVVSSGPYGYVRHPGYAGWMLACLAMPVALGSPLALAPVLLGGVGFIVRTALEDRFLMRSLPGYAEYAERVRYRLLPGVW